MPREIHQGGLVLARQCPGSPGTCNPEETGLPGLPVSWSPTLFSGSGPVGLTPVPWTEKTIERSPFSSTGAIEGHFEGKMPREIHQEGLVLARHCPGSPGTCNPEETGLPGLPVSWSPTLFSRSGPVGLTPVPWTEKTIERSPFSFRSRCHCCLAEYVKYFQCVH